MENKRYVEWNFLNPEHEAYFLNCFDGEEKMRREYPVLYGMLQHTKELAKEEGQTLKALKTDQAAGYVDRAHIHELVLKKNTLQDGALQESAAGNSLYSKGCTSLVSVKPAVHITLEIYKNQKRIARSFQTKTNVQYLEVDCLAEDISEITEGDSVYALLSCFWNEPESDVLRGGYMQEKLQLEGGKYVADVVCLNPQKKIALAPETILVSYGRGSAGNVDYSYSAGMRDEKGNQKVTLDVNGWVRLSGAVFKEYKAHDMSMFSTTKGVIMYNGAAPVCVRTQDGFSWRYDFAWKDSIQSSVQYGQHLYQFDMRLEFLVTDNDGNVQEQYIDVSSLNSEENNNSVVIPPLKLFWGCLGKDTPVQMADGSTKKISEIAVGERLVTPKGSAAVSRVWTGTEQEIYHIKTDNDREIFATGEHQFQTDGGYVRVIDLTSDTRLMTNKGGTMRAVYCYAKAYNDTVYSLDLEEGDSFFAAGFVSGTMERQNMVCSQKALPPVREDLKEELAKLDGQITEGEVFKEDRLVQHDAYKVSMTVKDGKVVLHWETRHMLKDDWIGLYSNASDGDDKYIGGAWQWASRGSSYQTNVDVMPGLQARYIRGRSSYRCMAKTDPFPAVDEAVNVLGFFEGTQEKREEPVDETLYDMTPEEAAAILRQKEPQGCRDAGYGVYGKCMLGYKKGKFVIDWDMDAYEPYDWIGLYKNSSAGQNDYITYQWVKRKAPYETSAVLNAGRQIRYFQWIESERIYVAIAESSGFKDLEIRSNLSDYPYTPDDALFAFFQDAFPELRKSHTAVTGAYTEEYNCIAWSLGFNDRWINPESDLDAFRDFYIQAGCEEKAWNSADAAICAWALGDKPTHGSRRYHNGGGLWESKLGAHYRITHGQFELEGDTYGRTVMYFSAPKKFMAQRERTVLTAKHYERLGMLVDETDNALRETFESLFAKLKDGWRSEAFRYESDTASIRRLPAYTALLEMGEAVLPLLAAKLVDEENFFALPLYDELQSDGELRISYQDERHREYALEGEQERARRSVAAYLSR